MLVNLKHGKGTIYFKTSNSKFVGEFVNGYRYSGTDFYSDGRIYAKWANGSKVVKEKSKETIIYRDKEDQYNYEYGEMWPVKCYK